MLWHRRIARVLWVLGVILLAAYAVMRTHGRVMARRDVRHFRESRIASGVLPGDESVDYRLWSAQRIRAHRESLTQAASSPLAILRIPKIALEVPVLDGTDDFTLNRAVGRIEGTARPGEGNVGIAGHRDGFFRGLKDVSPGDSIELDTASGSQSYRVDQIWIVDPEDVSVLDPASRPMLTLVSCYPFYFVGPAPKRYIVRALLEDPNAVPRNR